MNIMFLYTEYTTVHVNQSNGLESCGIIIWKLNLLEIIKFISVSISRAVTRHLHWNEYMDIM
jgi:hypothetical protein